MGDGLSEIQALNDVKEAFKGAILVMLENGDFIKEPSTRESKVRINITLDKSLLNAIDKVTHNRSKFLADCARIALNV